MYKYQISYTSLYMCTGVPNSYGLFCDFIYRCLEICSAGKREETHLPLKTSPRWNQCGKNCDHMLAGGALLFCLHQMALLYIGHVFWFVDFGVMPAIINCRFWSMTSWIQVIMSHHCVTLDFNKYTQLYRRNVCKCFRSSTIITLIYFQHIQYQLWKGILNAKLDLNQLENTTSYNWSISNRNTWQNLFDKLE